MVSGGRSSLPALALLGGLALAGPARAAEPAAPTVGAAAPDEDGEAPSKKALFLKDKAERRPVRARRPAAAAEPALSLRNLWTNEILPVRSPALEPTRWSGFLRCHHTNQRTEMDGRLFGLLRAAASKFGSQVIEIVSGFRAPKYNLMLRKKGHQVARDSQHTLGHAVDFRLPGVPVATLRRFVLQQRLGGVGFYPRSEFIHADTGPVRTWTAE